MSDDIRPCRAQRGVTLIELVTVLVVVAILATVAVGSYRRYIVRANRTDATGVLLRVQVAQEKYFLQNNTYTKSTDALGVTSLTPQGYYTLSVAEGDSGDISSSFKATATARNAQGTQDADCQSLSIDDKGVRGSTPGPTSTCWK